MLDNEAGRRWLKERFRKVQEIIEESLVYQETLQKGREEGRQQGLQTAQQTAIRIVAARFPELEQLAREAIETVSDLKQLQTLTIELSVTSSQEQAKELLLSLVSVS